MGDLMHTPESVTAGLFLVTAAPAGWYQVNDEARRWFDGHRWTDHYAPVITGVNSEQLIHDRADTDIGLHVMMVIMTLGAWLPVWGVLAGLRSIRNRPFGHSGTERRVKLAPIVASL